MSKSVFTVYIIDSGTGKRLYLKYSGPKPEITFSNNGGYKWKYKERAEDFITDNELNIECFVEEIEIKRWEGINAEKNFYRWTASKGFVCSEVKRGKPITVRNEKQEIAEEKDEQNPFFEEKTFQDRMEEIKTVDPELEEDEIKSFHEICTKCSRRCKQNPNATIMNCPIFNKAA